MTLWMRIEEADNGYVVQDNRNGITHVRVFRTLDELMTAALLYFESRAFAFDDPHYGRVIIERERPEKD